MLEHHKHQLLDSTTHGPFMVLAVSLIACLESSVSAQWVPDFQSERVGLWGAANTGSSGYQSSFIDLHYLNSVDVIGGYSQRVTGVSTTNGTNTWVWKRGTGTVQVGLTDAAHTGSAGYQFGNFKFQNAAGQVVGFSSRISDVAMSNGVDSWAWTAATGTVQIGLTGAAYTGSGGRQFSSIVSMNASGQVVGTSDRYTSANESLGISTWVWAPGAATVQTGLVDAVHVAADGYHYSVNNMQNDLGQIAGATFQANGLSGYNTWVWRGAEGTVQTGLTTAPYTGSNGYQSSVNSFQNASGQVAGYSQRVPASGSGSNGQNTWVWTAQGGTILTGLTGPVFTGSDGYQSSSNNLQNSAGCIAGTSLRITGVNSGFGTSSWVWTATAGTQETGLSGVDFTGSTGYRFSANTVQPGAEQVAGYTKRVTGVNTSNGQNAWAWTPETGTVPIGLTDADHTGSSGYQYSDNNLITVAGQVVGNSDRITGVSTANGSSVWVWTPAMGTVKIGLIGPEYTGSTGYQISYNPRQNLTGQVMGYSRRVIATNIATSTHTWAWSAAAGTIRTGLADAQHTNPTGSQSSTNTLQNNAGHIAGYSFRFTGAVTSNGQDVWYFDPTTGQSHQPTLGVVNAVRSDGYAYSSPSVLTADGYLFGTYKYFPGGQGSGEDRAFVYRPDRGFAELRSLISRGASTETWANLQSVPIAVGLDVIAGSGLIEGQTSGQSVYVMYSQSQPAACGPSDIGRQGGVDGADGSLDNNDFIAFINWFFNADPRADRGVQGGESGQDGQFDNNDFVVFINQFFAGC